MELDERYDAMSLEELEQELKLARARLKDVEDTFNFTLANTNTHLADAMVLEFEQDLYDHRDIVAHLADIVELRKNRQ